jgi:CheY-like chemotaxis protein
MMDSSADPKANVLYVDDIQANLMLFEASFESSYHILLAASGKEALEILKEKEVHVIVSDQNMPGMSGNELLEKVTKEYPDIMRFMITAYTDYETVVEAINKGHLYGFFNKPYNTTDVIHSIDQSLEVRNLRIKNREMIEKLEKANELMMGLDRSKTRFLASVTEEIRTPINKIMTAVHMIKDKIDSTELAELLDLLDVSVGRLEGFSEAAKQLVRLNEPGVELNNTPVSLKEIAEVGVIEKGNQISNKKLVIRMEATSEDSTINGEYDMIQASFSSLLGYSIEHMAEASEIVVGIHHMDGRCELNLKCKGSEYSEKEVAVLKSLTTEKQNFVDRDIRLEIILANEIMQAHKGSLYFDEGEEFSGFRLAFPK